MQEAEWMHNSRTDEGGRERSRRGSARGCEGNGGQRQSAARESANRCCQPVDGCCGGDEESGCFLC